MELLPSEYRQLELNKYEKLFVNYSNRSELGFGLVLLKINPAMIKGESVHAVITSDGVLVIKFYQTNSDAAHMFSWLIENFYNGAYSSNVNTIGAKLKSNKALLDDDGELALPFSMVLAFPELCKAEINLLELTPEMRSFAEEHCMFAETFSELRTDFDGIVNNYISYPSIPCSVRKMIIKESNANSVIQRIAPEYTLVRFATVEENNSTPGASEELLVIDENDVAVRAYRLEPEQINIVNKMTKGEQLILACAGSGKSVLLIAKCFKAARMNPDKKFLITCFNRNLQSLYTWFIERAGLKERNVECCTFDALCKRLLERNNLFVPGGASPIEPRRFAAMKALAENKISDRYYGIFIDEVQMFETEWYKFCYNLLENKSSDDHIFLICGDKTQEIKKRQHNGKAPWNAGEGYPTYRGGNRSIRIEKNFRNCIEINEFINRYAQNARSLVAKCDLEKEFDPDVFLRGQAFRHGKGVSLRTITGNAKDEAQAVLESIRVIHDEAGIPYDEIAIAMYNRQFAPMHYYLDSALQTLLIRENIPFNLMYNSDQGWAGHFGDGGVSLITFDSVLGLDYQGVIVCGIKPLGVYDHTKQMQVSSAVDEGAVEDLKKNISYLYVACTRAKDHLHIILSEPVNKSIYYRLLIDSI